MTGGTHRPREEARTRAAEQITWTQNRHSIYQNGLKSLLTIGMSWHPAGVGGHPHLSHPSRAATPGNGFPASAQPSSSDLPATRWGGLGTSTLSIITLSRSFLSHSIDSSCGVGLRTWETGSKTRSPSGVIRRSFNFLKAQSFGSLYFVRLRPSQPVLPDPRHPVPVDAVLHEERSGRLRVDVTKTVVASRLVVPDGRAGSDPNSLGFGVEPRGRKLTKHRESGVDGNCTRQARMLD